MSSNFGDPSDTITSFQNLNFGVSFIKDQQLSYYKKTKNTVFNPTL